ncbi:MAG: LamG-like jellyroll fold domain-containing protein, partial [Promethearchaeota archaeon]
NDDFRIKAGNGVGGTQIIDFINNGMESNRWYHVKLEIDLENDNVTIYVDSVNYGTYNFIDDNEFSSFNCISFYMETDVVYSSYIDAVGYSWDSDYVVGDNWHYNSYNGTWNFENISTQEFSHEGTIDFNNITMAEGYYYGTYSFEGEVNETDLDISFVSAISSAEAIVNSEYGNHLEVINVSSSAFARTENYFSFQTSGTIEFWFNIQADVTTSFCLREGSSTRVYVGYSSSANDLYWYNSGSTEHGSAISLDTWYHLRIEFDTDTDLFSVYMNGNTEGVNKTFYSVSSTITRFMFEDSGNQVLCVDAIGYSWDSQYNEGYNINAYDLNPFLDNDFDILNNDYFMNVSIENDIHGHNNVLKLQENDNTNYLRIESQFGLKSSGVIECWVLTDSVQDWTTFLSIARYNSHRGYLYANSGNFYWHTITSGILDTGITITTNTWYHIRILFDSSTNDVDISINGDLVLESASYSGGQIDSIIFNTPSSGTNNLYIDVIGYSWDSNYDVGDNKYGADLGDSWWLFNSEDCNASIVGEDTSHKKTLKISDYSSSNSINATNYFSNQTSGTIEFWIKISNNTKTFEITMLSSSGQKSIYIILNSTTSQWAWYDGAYHDVLACENDVWYHFKINFDCSTDTYDWYINSILEVDDADFENSASSINCLKITTWSSQTDYTIYLDALSYSWDSDYDVGDNLYTDLCEYELQVDILLTEFSYTDYMCFMNITSYYKTDVDVSVDFLVHDNDNSVWLTINSSLNYADFYESHLGLNNETMQDIFDGDNEILLRFDASSVEKAFKLHIDCLNVSAFYKLLLSKDKTFTLLGLWKYRFHIPEDSFSSDWYYFNVIEHEDNFMAISESPYITKWILIGNDTEISTSIRFADDITGDSWSLYDGNDDPLSETFTKIVYCNGDTWVTTSNPNSQSWYTWSYSTTTWNAYATTYSFFSYPEVGYMYSYANTTWNVRGYEDHESSMFDIHSTFYFEESTITWNNKPALDDLLYNDQEIAVSAEWKSYDVGYIDENIYFAVTPEVLYTDVEFSTKESAYDSYLIHYPYKFKQYDGYFFVQGNSTETLKTKSSVFADVSLNAGDYFTIDCETDLENMDLQLLNEGTVVDTITLLYENTYEERQIIEVSVDNDVVFDQLQFVGSFDDTNYFICNDIRANGYDSSTQE